MRTILITAYAVNPFKGSEDGTGWNIVREIAQEFNVILVTRKNNIQHLDRYFSLHGTETNGDISYYGFDLPDWVLKLKKRSGTKGHVAYFYFWQRNIIRFLKERSFEFSVSLSLNFHSDSHPHFLWKLNKPCVWGPIGHHTKQRSGHQSMLPFLQKQSSMSSFSKQCAISTIPGTVSRQSTIAEFRPATLHAIQS